MADILITTGDILAKYDKIEEILVEVTDKHLSDWERILEGAEISDIDSFKQEIPLNRDLERNKGQRYLSKRDRALDIAYEILKSEALKQGANAVVFVNIVHEEFAKGKTSSLKIRGTLIKY